MQWFFDQTIFQWVLIPTQPPLPQDTTNYTQVLPPLPPPLPPPQNHTKTLDEIVSSTVTSITATNIGLTSTTKTTCEIQDDDNSLDSKIKKYLSAAVSPTSSTLLIKSGLSPTMDNKISLSTTMKIHGQEKPMVKKLPPDWKAKKNEKGSH